MNPDWIEEHARIVAELIASGVEPDEANQQACALATEALAERLAKPAEDDQ